MTQQWTPSVAFRHGDPSSSVTSRAPVFRPYAMHGYVNRALQNLIVRKYGGRHVWDRIRELAAQKPKEREELCERHIYDDDFTFRLFQEASELCGVSETELLEEFGEQFLIWCREYAYDRTLQSLGATVRDFLCNLDSLHDHLETHMFPGMKAPSFRCSDGPNGEIYLHYYSHRRGLEYLVIGILKTVCRQLHNTIVEVEIIQQVDDTNDHVVFAIKELGPVNCQKEASSHSLQMFKPDHSYIDKVSWSPVPAAQFCQIFPFHIIFDNRQRILQMGTSLFRVLTSYDIDIQHVRLCEVFEVERPQGMTFDFSSLNSHINMAFIVSLKNSDTSAPLRLKGQMMVLNDQEDSFGKMLFLCSPRVSDLADLSGRRLYVSDLPLHDATRDLMLLDDARSKQHSQIIKLEDMNSRLDIANRALAKAHKELAKQKDLTDRLLYSMFPVHVATQLKKNEEVAAESFSSVTILFSDIVDFTTICGQCHPSEVVTMLHSLYKEFDAVTWENNLYKVETIGDAYMVVGGLTDKTECHEEMVCNQALDMITVVTKVKNPIDSKDHIHIRVGIHSGEAMAGVVGHLMPRYCLFGDTVNIANRTESTGQPDKIQVTEVTYKGLEMKPKFVFEDPHVVRMKNIQCPMQCYFLVDNKERHQRRLDLLMRRPSLVATPRIHEVESSSDRQRRRVSTNACPLSPVKEENEPRPLEKSRQLVELATPPEQSEHRSETGQETLASLRNAYSKRGAMAEERAAGLFESRTLNSIVWLLSAILIATLAACIAIYS